MKYIVLSRRVGGLTYEYPIIFPEALVHEDVAKAMLCTKEFADGKVVSAGMLASFAIQSECYGESVSLGKLKSRGEVDTRLIKMSDYGGGIK